MQVNVYSDVQAHLDRSFWPLHIWALTIRLPSRSEVAEVARGPLSGSFVDELTELGTMF